MNQKEWQEGIMFLLKEGRYDIVDALITNKKFVTESRNKGNELLKLSVNNGDMVTIKLLVESGFWVD